MTQYLVIAVVIGMLVLGITVQTKRLEATKAEYAAFVAAVKAKGEEQERKSKEKEAQDAKQIKDAVSGRNAALAKLRQSANPRSRPLSRGAEAPAGSSQICFGAPAYNTARGRYREVLERGLGGIQPLAIEGDSAQIDAQALIKAWPLTMAREISAR